MEPVKVITFKWVKEGYRSQFPPERVNTLLRMLQRHTTVPFELICVTDDWRGLDSAISPYKIWPNPVPAYGGGNNPNCLVRLPMFGRKLSDVFGPKWVWVDLDGFICGNVDHILTDPHDLRIWRPTGGSSKCNGSLVSHVAGTRTHIWDNFDPAQVGSVEEFRSKTNHLGSDQAWIATQLTDRDAFFDETDGVFAFRSLRNQYRERWLDKIRRIPARPTLAPKLVKRDIARRVRIQQRTTERDAEKMSTALPPHARWVFFPGQWHPWDADVRKIYPWIEEHYR